MITRADNTTIRNAFPDPSCKYKNDILSGDRFIIYWSVLKTSADSVEIPEGLVIDYDSEGQTVGIDMDDASSQFDLTELSMNKLPV